MTIYRENGDKVERTIVENCYFEYSVEETTDMLGRSREVKCFLAAPVGVSVCPGDRVLRGVGPEVSSWAALLPAIANGVAEIRYARLCLLHGQPHHIEAGR